VDARVLLAVTVPPALLSFGMDVLWAVPPFVMSVLDLSASGARDLNLLGDGPGKARQFSSDRGRDHGG
jgi:hypothetical protein